MELPCEPQEFDCYQTANSQRYFMKQQEESVSQSFNGETDLKLIKNTLKVSAQYIA